MDNLFLILFLVSLVGLIVGLIKPSSLSRFLKEKATRKNSAIIFGSATLIFFILFGVTTEPSKNNNSQNEVVDATPNQASPVDYEIVKSEDQSHKALGNKSLSDYTAQEISNLPIDKKMLYRIVVSPKIKENEVQPTIQKIISDITQKDNDIDEITLFLYSDKELSSGPYDIGTATWAPKGKLGNITPEIAESNNRTNYKTTIQIKENLEDYLSQRGKTEDKFGLTEEKRRQFFKEIVAAEDRANSEAEKLYPIDSTNPALWDGNTFLQDKFKENMDKNMDKADELMEKYRAEVRAKYNLTKEQSSEITTEAFKEGWPLE